MKQVYWKENFRLLIIVLLKMTTCLLPVLWLKKVFRFTNLIGFLILLVFNLL